MKITHPYTNLEGGRWMRGNLHAHTTRSDGHMTLQQVIDAYADAEHDFLTITDHNAWASPADYRGCDARGLILIPGNEVSDNGPDILHVGADRLVASTEQRQTVLDEIGSGPGFAIVNHPNIGKDYNHCPFEHLMAWNGYTGIEIFNGSARHTYGSNQATDKWDMLLSHGRRAWGFANDDSHEDYQVGLAWNAAYVTDPTVEGVLAALRQGRFYASSGVVIKDIQVRGKTIRIETENAHHIAATREYGVRFCQTDGPVFEAQVQDTAPYVRFECWGSGEQKAWTQPFFITHD